MRALLRTQQCVKILVMPMLREELRLQHLLTSFNHIIDLLPSKGGTRTQVQAPSTTGYQPNQTIAIALPCRDEDVRSFTW